MKKNNYNVLGVMSGTSLDGIDIAHLQFTFSMGWEFSILETETVSYSDFWVQKLKNAIDFSTEELEVLNEKYTELLAQIISNFIKKHQIKNIDAVCSHGHTILHQPQNGFTLQIGNLPKIALLVQQNVVCDFRVQDVLLGGQGAPLVPIGDALLFSNYDFCLNLGGFSNISWQENGNQIAFDISPVNTVLNFYANQLGLEYDDKGTIAKSGNLHPKLLNALNSLEFYQKKYPKSLGFEFVQSTVLPLIDSFSLAVADVLHTFTIHVAMQIANVLQNKSGKLLVTGGGAYHLFLIEKMQEQLPNIEIIVPNDAIIQYKEALIFGFLGVLKLRNEINVLASVTGASQDHSSGAVFVWEKE